MSNCYDPQIRFAWNLQNQTKDLAKMTNFFCSFVLSELNWNKKEKNFSCADWNEILLQTQECW